MKQFSVYRLAAVSIACIISCTNSTADDLRWNNFGEGEKFDIAAGYEEVSGSSVLIPDMNIPRVRNQGGTKLCQAFCATALVQIEACRQKNVDCKQLPPHEEISPISLLMYSGLDKNQQLGTIPAPVESGNVEVHSILNAISRVPGDKLFYSEGCIPFEAYQERLGYKYAANKTLFHELEQSYYSATAASTSVQGVTCEECAALAGLMREWLGVRIDSQGVLRALRVKSFDEFLFEVIFREGIINNSQCREVLLKKGLSFQHYPRRDTSESARPTSLVEAFAVLKEKLREGRAVSMSALCFAQEKSGRNRCSTHCVVITGFKVVKKIATGERTTIFRVLNSWGTSWHKATNGGWITQEVLQNLLVTSDDRFMEKAAALRSQLFASTFSWLLRADDRR
jgi:hypothetical protein